MGHSEQYFLALFGKTLLRDTMDWVTAVSELMAKTPTLDLTLHVHTWLDICDNCAAAFAQVCISSFWYSSIMLVIQTLHSRRLHRFFKLRPTDTLHVIVSSSEPYMSQNEYTRMCRALLTPLPTDTMAFAKVFPYFLFHSPRRLVIFFNSMLLKGN